MTKLFDDPEIIPARALWQPYAGLVALGLKAIETCKTETNLRGDLVVCAGWTLDLSALVRVRSLLVPHVVPLDVFEAATSVHGVAMAVVNVTGCRRLVESDRRRSFWWNPREKRRSSTISSAL